MSVPFFKNASRSVVWLSVLTGMFAFPGCRMLPEAKEARYLKRGKALAQNKDYSRALLEFRNAAAAMPKDAEPHFRMGLVYLEMGDGQNAVRALERATTLNPKHSGAQLKLAELMTATRDEKLIGEAITRLVDVFGPSPDDPEAADTLALANWKLGKPEDAMHRLEEALKNFPTHLETSVTMARMKLAKDDWSGAEEVLKKAVADAPQSSQAALALGDFYAFLRRPEEAERELGRALQLDPKNGAALISLAGLQMAAGRQDEADKAYRQLTALPEKAYKPLHAIFLYQTGKRDAAVAEFEVLAKSDVSDREARNRLVTAYFATNRFSDAEKVLSAALKRNPKDTDALLQ